MTLPCIEEDENVRKLVRIHSENAEEKRADPGRSARLQLLLPTSSVERLDALKNATEAVSYAEVIRRALRLYEALLAERRDGSSLVVRRTSGEEETVPLGFLGL